jgi:hypothetical protein
MAEEARRTYTIRLAEHVAARVEAQATGLGIAPTTLIQSLITRQFDNGPAEHPALDPAAMAALGRKLDALDGTFELLERAQAQRYDQLLFEVVKTRAALFHGLDQTLSAPVVDGIIEASERTARQYIGGLVEAEEVKR